jgi:hypothetical protein
MVRGYVNNKLFITSNNIPKIKYALEQEVAHNGATSATIIYPTCIFNEYKLIDGRWVQSN